MAWNFELVAGPFKGRTGGLAWDGKGMLFSAVAEECIYRYDPASGKAEIFRKYTGRTNGLAFSADGSRLMTSGTDGFVKVWEVATGVETVRIPLDGVSDGHWLDEEHILVATATGLWTTLTLDTDELTDLARSRLTRYFTPEECTTYRIEDCT